MPKKIKKWMIVLIALAAITAIGVTFAFMFKKASITNTFVRAEVSCVVYEKMDDTEVVGSFFEGNEKSDIRVQNTGNVNEYLHVRLVSYFVDEDKNITGDIPCVYPEIILNEKWLQGKDNIYYYTEAVEPNGFTSELCQPFALEKKVTRDGKTLYQVVEVFAEAIQAESARAVKSAWDVTVINGVIAPKQ